MKTGATKGFTLVEMLVALLVFGLLAAAGVAVMRSTVQSQAAVRARTESIGELQRLRAILKADLSQAALRRTRGPTGERDLLTFAGGAADGRLIGLVRRGWENPDGAPRASMQYVEYRLVEGRLERRVRPALDGAALQDAQVLAEGVAAAEVGFYGREQWRPSWDIPDALPEAVRLDLSLEGLGQVSQLFLTSGASR
jgi:general secretion pathway protein J